MRRDTSRTIAGVPTNTMRRGLAVEKDGQRFIIVFRGPCGLQVVRWTTSGSLVTRQYHTGRLSFPGIAPRNIKQVAGSRPHTPTSKILETRNLSNDRSSLAATFLHCYISETTNNSSGISPEKHGQCGCLRSDERDHAPCFALSAIPPTTLSPEIAEYDLDATST